MCYSKSLIQFYGKQSPRGERKSISLPPCSEWDFWALQNIQNPWEQPSQLTQKLATEKTTSHSWHYYVATNADHYYADITEGL